MYVYIRIYTLYRRILVFYLRPPHLRRPSGSCARPVSGGNSTCARCTTGELRPAVHIRINKHNMYT